METLHVNHSWELKAELCCYLKRKKKKERTDPNGDEKII